MKASLYYRGSLSSCNYSCPYCPFGRMRDSRESLERDRRQVQAFVGWVRAQGQEGHRLSIMFIPHGEALIHEWYREAMAALSGMEHVDKAAVQTNLSASLDWTHALNPHKAAFWATYHPGQAEEAAFLDQCAQLDRRSIPYSVGAVGVRSAFTALLSLRRKLSPHTYMWINAYKDQPDYYAPADAALLRGIDPHFDLNAADYDSFGRHCRFGEDAFYVQGSGLVKRCCKDRRVIGRLEQDGLEGLSQRRSCRMPCCDCYIGYIHLPHLGLAKVYGERLLERIPVSADQKG